jgi:hypothetical protein
LVGRDVQLDAGVDEGKFVWEDGQAREETWRNTLELLAPKLEAALLADGGKEVNVMGIGELV